MSLESPVETLTFKERVEKFWSWFPTVAERFYQTIENGKCVDLTDEVKEFTDRYFPGISWVFGPGEVDGHSFTLTGEGDIALQLLTEYWLSQAVKVKGWTFYASRQASPEELLSGFEIELEGNDRKIGADKLLISPTVDEPEEKIDIVGWHPEFAHLPEDAQWQIFFIFLDDAMGEFGTQTWIGEIDIHPIEEDAKKFPVSQMKRYAENLGRQLEWKKLHPLETYTLYQLEEQTNDSRCDTIVGTTCIPSLVNGLLQNQGRLDTHPAPELGVEFAYIRFNPEFFPDGDEQQKRAQIEDALDEKLITGNQGRTLGGAFGVNAVYIDLVLIDGEKSNETIDQVLNQLGLGGHYQLVPYVQD